MSQSVYALNLKDFFTLTETAKQLSHALNTVVAESDVVRLSLDGRLPLTMYTKDVMARHGVLVPYEDTKWIKGNSLLELKGYPATDGDYGISREGEILPFNSKRSVIKFKSQVSASDEKPTYGMRNYILATHQVDGVLHKKLIKPNFVSFSSKPDEKHFSEMLRHHLGVDCTLEYINFRSSSHAYVNGLWSFPLSEGNAQILERRYFELCTENPMKQWNIPAGKEQTICLERDNEFCVLTDSEQAADCCCSTNQLANVLDAYSADYGNDTTELVRQADDMADLMLELPETPAHELPVGCFLVVKTKDIESFLKGVAGCKNNPSNRSADTPVAPASLARAGDNTPRPSIGGRPQGTLREAVEMAYNTLSGSGNTEVIKTGNRVFFLQYLKDSITPENGNYSDDLAERLKEVKNVNGDCRIIIHPRTDDEVLRFAKTGENIEYKKGTVSKILTYLRRQKK